MDLLFYLKMTEEAKNIITKGGFCLLKNLI
jgi:hypothetical protein